MEPVYCPHCGWKQRTSKCRLLRTVFVNMDGSKDVVYSFHCEFCNEKVRAELQDTKLGELL